MDTFRKTVKNGPGHPRNGFSYFTLPTACENSTNYHLHMASASASPMVVLVGFLARYPGLDFFIRISSNLVTQILDIVKRM